MAHILPTAEVQYGDLSGTPAANRADAGAIGLDSDRWWIHQALRSAAAVAEPRGTQHQVRRRGGTELQRNVSLHTSGMWPRLAA